MFTSDKFNILTKFIRAKLFVTLFIRNKVERNVCLYKTKCVRFKAKLKITEFIFTKFIPTHTNIMPAKH
jgi:hypothetical protein